MTLLVISIDDGWLSKGATPTLNLGDNDDISIYRCHHNIHSTLARIALDWCYAMLRYGMLVLVMGTCVMMVFSTLPGP
jgi:hypothetical protein